MNLEQALLLNSAPWHDDVESVRIDAHRTDEDTIAEMRSYADRTMKEELISSGIMCCPAAIDMAERERDVILFCGQMVLRDDAVDIAIETGSTHLLATAISENRCWIVEPRDYRDAMRAIVTILPISHRLKQAQWWEGTDLDLVPN